MKDFESLNLDNFVETHCDKIANLCDDAFNNHQHCECTYKGYSGDWYNPPEPTEYEVTGWEQYEQDVINQLTTMVAEHFELTVNNELTEFVRGVWTELIDIDSVWNKDQFYEASVNQYLNSNMDWE